MLNGPINWYLPLAEITTGTYTFSSEGLYGACLAQNTTWKVETSLHLETWVSAPNPLSEMTIKGPLHFYLGLKERSWGVLI